MNRNSGEDFWQRIRIAKAMHQALRGNASRGQVYLCMRCGRAVEVGRPETHGTLESCVLN